MKSAPFMRILLLVIILGFSGGVAAETSSDDYFYVSSKELPPQLLPSPPTVGSTAALNDIEAVIAAQKHISAKDLKELKAEQNLRLEIITRVIGEDFTRDHFPKTYSLLDHVLSDVESITRADKDFWHTKRPYLVDHRVKLLVNPLDNSPGYPSGHTSGSYVIAEVLGQLYPNRLPELRARAAAIAFHRIEAGVHSPDDVEAGRLLAMQVIGALMENDDFQIDFMAAHDEIAKIP